MTRPARARRLALALLFLGVTAGSLAAQEPELARSQRMLEDRRAVLETVRELLRSLGARDIDRMEALHLPTATTVAVRLDGESGYPTIRTVPQVVESIAEVTVPMVERIWDLWSEEGKARERVGEFIQRVGMGNFLEAIELEPSAQMVSHPRENPYVFYEEYFEEGDEDEDEEESDA